MDDGHDELLERLARIDPTESDPPPARGSNRFQAIEENTMKLSQNPETVSPENLPATGTAPSPRRGRARFVLAAAVIAIAALAIGTLTLPGGTPSAEATIRAAAEATGDVNTLRFTSDGDADDVSGVTAEVNGTDAFLVFDDGTEATFLGDLEWFREGDGVLYQADREPENRPGPFPAASEALITAALQGGDISELGETELDGTTTTGYRIELDSEAKAAIGEIPAVDLGSWFDLDNSNSVDSISLWVANDLIYQISIEGDPNRLTTFYDFDADIEIIAPTE